MLRGTSIRRFCASVSEVKSGSNWSKKEDHRKFLESLRSKLNLKNVQELMRVTPKELKQEGGEFLLKEYPSFPEALKRVYPEEQWTIPLDTQRRSKNYWKSEDNIRAFLDKFADQLSLKNEEDWKVVSSRVIKECGGAGLFQKSQSLFDILTDVYPDRDWWKSGLQHKIPRSFWNSLTNQRRFMDKLGRKLNVSHWDVVSAQEIEEHGGGGLLRKYPTLFDLFHTVYPDQHWDIMKRTDDSYEVKDVDDENTSDIPLLKKEGSDEEDIHGLNITTVKAADIHPSSILSIAMLPPHRLEQREWMEELEQKLNIKNPNEWNDYTMDIVLENDGQSIAQEYPTLSVALKNLFPEHDWSALPQVRQLPHPFWSNYWKNRDNQIEFLLELEKRLNIEFPEQWLTVSEQEIKEQGGYGILFYHCTLAKAMRELLPDRVKDLHLSDKSSKWDDRTHCRRVLDYIATILLIRTPEDWKDVTVAQIKALGGGPILKKYSSIYNALCDIYPETNWNLSNTRKRFPANYWQCKENQRTFLDSISEKLSIQSKHEWGDKQILVRKQPGMRGILNLYSSYYEMLRSVYPEKNWDLYLEPTPLPKHYWSDLCNVKSFIERLAKKHRIHSMDIWHELTESVVYDSPGGRSLLQKYGSLLNILRVSFPDENWEPIHFNSVNGRVKYRFRTQIEKAFPGTTIVHNFTPNNLSLGGRKLKFPIFIPELSLGIKFYSTVEERKLGIRTLDAYYTYDEELAKICKQAGILSVVVPFWYDWSPKSLRDLIISRYPDITLPPFEETMNVVQN